MKSAASTVRNEQFDIRDAARREARRNGVSLGQWLDGVMTERADALGMRLVDLDPRQRIAAIVTRLNGPDAENQTGSGLAPQPRAGLEPYGLDAAAEAVSLGDPGPGARLNDETQEQVMRTEMAAPLRADDEPAAMPPILGNSMAPDAADSSTLTHAVVGAAARHAAQRVEIETKLNALFLALDRTPRRSDPDVSSDFGDEGQLVRRRRALMGETAIVPSWRLEKAVSEIADRQAFLERQSADAGAAVAKPASHAAPPAARRPAPEPVPAMFTSLQSDLARIAKRLDAVHLDVTRRPAAPSEPTVQEMRTLLGEMRPDASIDVLGRQVEALSSKLDTVIEQHLPREALSQLSKRIEDVHAELAARLAANTATGPVVDLAAIEQLIDAALDRAGRSAPAMPDLQPLESAVHDLADKLDKAERAQGDSTALADLQMQVGTLAARIDRSDVGLTAIVALERSLGNMFTQLGSMREASLEAVESTARAAAEETLQAAMARPDFAAHLSALSEAALGQMSQDVAQIRADRDDANSQLHAILAALNTSLERVVDRLGAIEEDAADTRRAPRDSLAIPAPMAAAPQPSAPDWSDSLEQAVALGVAEPPAEPASRHGDNPLSLTVPLKTEGWNARSVVSRARPDTFDDRAQPAAIAPDPTSFIAAARRAAQAAVQEQAQTPHMDDADEPARLVAAPVELRSRFKAGMLSKRRPLLLAAAGLVLLIGIAQVVRISLSGVDATGSIPAGDITATTPVPVLQSPPSPGPKADADDVAGPATPVDTATAIPAPQGAAEPETIAATDPVPVAPQATPGIIARSDPTAVRAPLPTMAMGPGASIAALQATETSARGGAPGLAPALRTQAEGGVPAAQFEVGLRYADGRGVGRDLPTAAHWFEKAAQQGLAPAAYRLGSLYEKGLGVPRDPAKAIAWYRKASDAGNIRAMHNLAVLLAEGATGKSDYPGAATWFTKAAQAGVRDSQFNLAILYARGLGVAQNLSQSYTWFAIAAAQGDQDSVKKRDEVESHLDAATLDQAKAAVAAFTPEPSVSAANDVPVPAGGWDAAPRGADGATGPKAPANAHLSRM